MEYYQAIQNRAAQTAAVLDQHFPQLRVDEVGAERLQELAQALGDLAQARDDALVAYDNADGAAYQSFVTLRKLSVVLPKMIQGELDDGKVAEARLLEHLDPVFAVDPRNSEAAQKRVKRLLSALDSIDAYLAEQTPPRGPIRSNGRGAAELAAVLAQHPGLEQQLERRATAANTARATLRDAAAALDQLNKRFYSKLKSETHGDATLTQILAQIDTGAQNLPPTLSIQHVRQGGTDHRQLLVNYVAATYDDGAKNFVEWRTGDDDGHGFTQSTPADPSGNALGPFAAGTRVQLRTRVSTGRRTTTGAVRTLTVA